MFRLCLKVRVVVSAVLIPCLRARTTGVLRNRSNHRWAVQCALQIVVRQLSSYIRSMKFRKDQVGLEEVLPFVSSGCNENAKRRRYTPRVRRLKKRNVSRKLQESTERRLWLRVRILLVIVALLLTHNSQPLSGAHPTYKELGGGVME